MFQPAIWIETTHSVVTKVSIILLILVERKLLG